MLLLLALALQGCTARAELGSDPACEAHVMQHNACGTFVVELTFLLLRVGVEALIACR
ncbi:MAG: hypothetical protein H0W72_10425 [Planctomycetes bacterium]|nr:hypothetical protein [Planctomycetota bacterium]